MNIAKCPICEAEQNFKLKQRFVKESQWGRLQEIYLSCKHCGYFNHIRYTTNEIERLNKRIAATKAQAVLQQQELGGVTDIVNRMLKKLSKEKNYEQELLELMINDYRNST